MIKITDLTFKYSEMDSFIFEKASLELGVGLWLLDGENGSGKSTLLKLIALKPEDRNKLGSLGSGSFIEVGEEIVLLDNQLVLPSQLQEKVLVDYLLDINSVTLDKPYKPLYEKKPLFQYSTGEQKMVIFRLLAHLNPKVLLVDEYISNLDEEHVPEVFALLESMVKNGSTVFCSSNELDIKGRFKNRVKINERKLEINE